MATIAAFRGIRYDLGHVGALAEVVAPPYDVIDAEQQGVLYRRHPANVVRLILNRDEPGDDAHSNCYTRAARFLRNWLREGVLFRESDPAVYVYHQRFHSPSDPDALSVRVAGGPSHTRRGFIARVRLEPFGEGMIHPHEQTHARVKEDRLRLWQSCRANLSPILGMYPDEENAAQGLLEAAIEGMTPLEVTDDDSTVHRLWPVTDVAVITKLIGAMGGRPIYIADGHHRYETALAYRDLHPDVPADHPANFVLMACVSMSDPGLSALPTHRLFRGLPPMTSEDLTERLGGCFACEAGGRRGSAEITRVWRQIELENSQGTLGLYAAADGVWTIARITDAGRARLAEITPGHSVAWRSLGVSILHRLVLDTLLDAANLPAPKYVRSLGELALDLQRGDAVGRDATGQAGTGRSFELAALVMPAGIEQIRAVCGAGERMPPKSTFFYPKLLSGLVINSLE